MSNLEYFINTPSFINSLESAKNGTQAQPDTKGPSKKGTDTNKDGTHNKPTIKVG